MRAKAPAHLPRSERRTGAANDGTQSSTRSTSMNAAEPDRKTLLAIYQKMALIKHSDDRVIGAMKAGRMQMPYYSARGQECIPAANSVLLNEEDYLVTIYRGVPDMRPNGLPAKPHGRATGRGK